MAGVESTSEASPEANPEAGPEAGAPEERPSVVDCVAGLSDIRGAKLIQESVDLLLYGLVFARLRLNCASVGEEDIL